MQHPGELATVGPAGDEIGCLFDGLVPLGEETAAEEVRAQLGERPCLLLGSTLRSSDLDRLADHLDRFDLIVGEIARPRASLEQRRALTRSQRLVKAKSTRVLGGGFPVRTGRCSAGTPRGVRTPALLAASPAPSA